MHSGYCKVDRVNKALQCRENGGVTPAVMTVTQAVWSRIQTYTTQCGWRWVFLKFFALYCNSLFVGARGSMRKRIPMEGRSSGDTCPFLKLHARQAVTVFVHASLPPLDFGITWSSERSLIGNISEQYCVRNEGRSMRDCQGAIGCEVFISYKNCSDCGPC
jgi:hypothetical protein